MSKTRIVVHDEGFEPASLTMIQDAGIQPAWIYGAGPWVVSSEPLTPKKVDRLVADDILRRSKKLWRTNE